MVVASKSRGGKQGAGGGATRGDTHLSDHPSHPRVEAVMMEAASGAASPSPLSSVHEYSTVSSGSDEEAGWERMTGKKGKSLQRKRLRTSVSPTDDGANPKPSYAAAAQQPGRSSAARTEKRKTLYGVSASSSIKASINLQVPKAVFRVGNVAGDCSTADLEAYLLSLEVRVISCFELPRSAKQPLVNKAFRICILAHDKAKLLNEKNWSFGIFIRPWIFKEKPLGVSGSREGSSQNFASVQVGQASSNAPSNNSQVDKENPGLSSSVGLNPNTSLAVGDSATLISGNQNNYDMH